MVSVTCRVRSHLVSLSVLALSSRFDGRATNTIHPNHLVDFQYSLCRVVLMVGGGFYSGSDEFCSFSTRSVESF